MQIVLVFRNRCAHSFGMELINSRTEITPALVALVVALSPAAQQKFVDAMTIAQAEKLIAVALKL